MLKYAKPNCIDLQNRLSIPEQLVIMDIHPLVSPEFLYCIGIMLHVVTNCNDGMLPQEEKYDVDCYFNFKAEIHTHDLELIRRILYHLDTTCRYNLSS